MKGKRYARDTDGRFLEVIWAGDPLELVSEFLYGVRETLDVSSTVIEEEETHGRRGSESDVERIANSRVITSERSPYLEAQGVGNKRQRTPVANSL